MKILWLLTTFIITNANATVILSKTLYIQPEVIEQIESKVMLAMNRSNEMMDYPLVSIISDDIATWCPPHLPLQDGLGCNMVFDFGSVQGSKITVKKDLDIFGIYKKIKSKLSTLDPSQTDEHIHFGSIFSEETSEGSHYFCYANEAKDDWKCELSVREEFN